MNFDGAYNELVERISDRIVEKLRADRPGNPDQEPWRLLNLEEAAERIGRSPRWIRERVRGGTLPVIRLDGGALAFELDDLRAFARDRRVDGAPELRVVASEWWRQAG